MIMTTDELKIYIETDLNDDVLKMKLEALELKIRAYTNNNFQIRSIRTECSIISGVTNRGLTLFKPGDTVEITESFYNNGLHIVKTSGDTLTFNDVLTDEEHCLVTKVAYPMDIKLGAVSLMKWDLERHDKAGVASESISRHSVTYFNMEGDNSIMGYPRSLMGFLEPYRKARF